jgi:hypothetical protein
MISIRSIAARLRPIQLKRNRRGYTLLEAILVLSLASILILGLGVLIVPVREQMWVSAQLRSMDQWALSYCNTWARVARNSIGSEIRRITPPTEMEFT